jgi:riboflavin synthase
MFTGIIQATSKVTSTKKAGECVQVRVAMPKSPKAWKLSLGQSISIDGICSTVTFQDKDQFEVEYMPETILKTTAGFFAQDAVVNLERSLTLADFVDGHIVQGHVDARAKVTAILEEESTRRIAVELPKELICYVAALGSIAINGVSLTVARLSGNKVMVALIPHTLAHTNLGLLKAGDVVNIEVDVMARHIVAALEAGRGQNAIVGYAKKTLRKGA